MAGLPRQQHLHTITPQHSTDRLFICLLTHNPSTPSITHGVRGVSGQIATCISDHRRMPPSHARITNGAVIRECQWQGPPGGTPWTNPSMGKHKVHTCLLHRRVCGLLSCCPTQGCAPWECGTSVGEITGVLMHSSLAHIARHIPTVNVCTSSVRHMCQQVVRSHISSSCTCMHAGWWQRLWKPCQ